MGKEHTQYRAAMAKNWQICGGEGNGVSSGNPNGPMSAGLLGISTAYCSFFFLKEKNLFPVHLSYYVLLIDIDMI